MWAWSARLWQHSDPQPHPSPAAGLGCRQLPCLPGGAGQGSGYRGRPTANTVRPCRGHRQAWVCGHGGQIGRLAAALFNKITDAGVACVITQHQDVVGEDGPSASRAGPCPSPRRQARPPRWPPRPLLPTQGPGWGAGQSHTSPWPGGTRAGPAWPPGGTDRLWDRARGSGPTVFPPARGSVGMSRDRPAEQGSAQPPGVFCLVTVHRGPGGGVNRAAHRREGSSRGPGQRHLTCARSRCGAGAERHRPPRRPCAAGSEGQGPGTPPPGSSSGSP